MTRATPKQSPRQLHDLQRGPEVNTAFRACARDLGESDRHIPLEQMQEANLSKRPGTDLGESAIRHDGRKSLAYRDARLGIQAPCLGESRGTRARARPKTESHSICEALARF